MMKALNLTGSYAGPDFLVASGFSTWQQFQDWRATLPAEYKNLSIDKIIDVTHQLRP